MSKLQMSEDYLSILDRIMTWISHCDTKASIIIGGVGVIVSVFLSPEYSKKLLAIYRYMIASSTMWSIIYMIAISFAIIAIICGSICLISVLTARINSSVFAQKKLNTDSLVFFSSIAKIPTFAAFKSRIQNYDNTDYSNDILSQIYICSLICSKKYKLYNAGLLSIVSGAILFAILFAIGIAIA